MHPVICLAYRFVAWGQYCDNQSSANCRSWQCAVKESHNRERVMTDDAMRATRRAALALGAGGLLALAPFEAAPAFAITGDQAGLPWANNAMRWAQVAFTEEDQTSYDPNFWFDLFKKTHVEAVCLSAGGCICFYPSKVPLHYRAKYLGDRDMFGEMVKGARI